MSPLTIPNTGISRRKLLQRGAALSVGLATGRVETLFSQLAHIKPSVMSKEERVLWCATVRNKPLPERVKAAQAGGFTQMSIFPADYKSFRDSGLSDRAMQDILKDSGVRIVIIDPYTKWVPSWKPPEGTNPENVAFYDFDEAAVFHMAEVFQVESLSVVEPFGQKIAPEVGAEHFADICDRAQARGNWKVHMEFMPSPISGIGTLATAWEMVRLANRDNGGMVFDIWHYLRGERDDDLLRTIPGEKIFRVQVSDARREVQESLPNDLLHYRMIPGQGDFDLVTVMTILEQIGGLSSMGVEIFSDQLDKMTAEEAGAAAGEGLRQVMQQLPTSSR